MNCLHIPAWVCVGLALAGCEDGGALSIAQGLQSEHPPERVQACIRAGERGDRSVLPLLVERLEDSAADVRFFAFLALRRLTGESLGYGYYEPPVERQAAVARWREWLKERKASGKGG